MKSRKRTRPAQMCLATKPAKVRYATLARAVKACTRVFFNFASRRLNNIYQCAVCGGFHMTTPDADAVGGQIASLFTAKRAKNKGNA